MTVQELNRNQLNELKQHYVFKKAEEQGYSPSYGELADAEDIPDEVIFEEYSHIHFVEEDFSTEEV